jgi:pantetheine-phosphate adenylyltransferase
VITFNELTASIARKHRANYVLRGLRNTTDFEYENSIAQVNAYLNKELETVFLITSPKYASISSSIMREVHQYKGNIDEFLPYNL